MYKLVEDLEPRLCLALSFDHVQRRSKGCFCYIPHYQRSSVVPESIWPDVLPTPVSAIPLEAGWADADDDYTEELLSSILFGPFVAMRTCNRVMSVARDVSKHSLLVPLLLCPRTPSTSDFRWFSALAPVSIQHTWNICI